MSITHVHPNPGYGEYEHHLKRAATNPELLNSSHYAESVNVASTSELSQIKDWSKRVWSARDRCETTYQFQYPEKKLDEHTTSAPTERERIHKPHPPTYFLTNRLHYVPGYHNADARLGKSPYQPDAACGEGERSYRVGLKSKYDGGICDKAVRPYVAQSADYDITKWNRTLPPNDTWMAASSSSNGEC
ncbi:hypothetical protein EB796_011193 [Bugula neritina]|uniref:Uncharacterized protein n=1 Tax=Bugula neritina TaxID=10212 RepID=A0A7J7JX11_BUGNE|nr:hypothetical protein EB796_022402 [Bugula neritina]KAF6030497.1 hypothetical protein EB796_011193 [Bugula neritina]